MTRFRVTALPGGGGACRVDIELTRPWKYTPGSHAYVYLPWVSFWQSHPFSIAWSNNPNRFISGADHEDSKIENEGRTSYESEDSNETSTITLSPSPPPDRMCITADEKMPITPNPFNRQNNRNTPMPDLQTGPDDIAWSDKNTLSMVIARRTGMTKRLYDLANARPNKTIYFRGCLEGEYGGHHGLYSYGMVVLIGGGVGITHCIGWARELLQLYKEGRGVARRVVLVWIVPDQEQYEWCREWFDEIFAIPGWQEVRLSHNPLLENYANISLTVFDRPTLCHSTQGRYVGEPLFQCFSICWTARLEQPLQPLC